MTNQKLTVKNMEILYYSKTTKDTFPLTQNIRWLTVDDYEVFCSHLKLCGQRSISKRKWKEIYSEGTDYCGLFIGDKMVSRACVEKYSSNAWEVADVRTAADHRGNGYACQVCCFVLNYILT